MFEALDKKILEKLSGFDNSLSEKMDASLEQLLACLESGRNECANTASSEHFSSLELRQIGEGFFGAQQIVANIWGKKAVE